MATRSIEAGLRRAMSKLWEGLDPTGFEQPPNLLNGESLLHINAAGTGTVASVAVNSSDQVTIGGKVAVTTQLITFNIAAGATAADFDGVIAVPFAWKLVSVTERHQTAGSDTTPPTLMVKKVPSGTAKASGTDMLSAGINLHATADTNQAGAIHGTAANITGAAGDGIGLVTTGTLTALDGVTVTCEIQRV